MPLIGTAGHVDHGKSTLIKAITGRNPDRWSEEQTRGLTIDLGFAWTTLPQGHEVSFVDVPGHEKFLKNMLAGIEAIDVALFVVAADEGWMPQSEEHLAVLDLLGVSRAVVALTKVDTVDEDLAELAVLEVADRLTGTSLANSPIVKVSGTTGAGIDDLLAEIEQLIPADPTPNRRPRMWIDRSFPVQGAGTVVTGSLLDSTLNVDDQVEIYPGAVVRIRTIQSHERTVDQVAPGRRVALNLSGVDHQSVERGQMIGLPGQWATSDRFSAHVRIARFVEEFDKRGAYQVHIGSSARSAVITGLAEGTAVITLDRAVPMAVGDRFIIRDTGRRLVVAGGRVADPHPGRTVQALHDAHSIDPDAEANEIATQLLRIRGVDSPTRIEAESGGGKPATALFAGEMLVDPKKGKELGDRAVALVRQEHVTNPLRPGLPLATLATQLEVAGDLAEAIVEGASGLHRVGPDVAATDHQSALNQEQETAWRKARETLGTGLAVPPEGDLGLDAELIAHLIRQGELVRISPGLVLLPDQIGEIVDSMRELDDEFTVADLRDKLGLSRKYVVPIVEWADKEGLTSRRGDIRRLR